MTKRVVLTGGMGSGKTAIMRELAAMGHEVVHEPARIVLAEQRAIRGRGVPEHDPALFCELMLDRSLAAYEATADALVLFDRGVPDLVGYAAIFELDTSRFGDAARTHRYDDVVFVTSSWPDIYTTDDERTMSYEQADAFGHRVRDIYAGLGYTLVDVPRDTPAERARFIVESVT